MVPKDTFNRAGLEDLVKRRFFYAPAFSIYGGEFHVSCLPCCQEVGIFL
jgi:hypothetical protein